MHGIPEQPESGGGIGISGRSFAGAGVHPFGHHAGESAALMLYVHFRGAVLHVVPQRAVHSLAMLPGFFQTAV